MSSQLETPKTPLRMRRSHTALPKISTSSPITHSQGAPHTGKESHSQSHKSHHHHHWYSGDTIKSAVQLQNPFSFQDILKQHNKNDSRTPAGSRTGSRRPSVTRSKNLTEDNSGAGVVTQEDVFKERIKARMREDELRGSLHQLSEHSFKATRQLDETYYSILERTAQLRTTINALQELHGLTGQLRRNFNEEVTNLEDEVQGQIDNLQSSEQQRGKVELLRARIVAGSGKAHLLKLRLEEASRRIDASEARDAERQVSKTRWLRAIWGIVATVLTLIFVLMNLHRISSTESSSTDLIPSEEVSLELSDASLPADTRDEIVDVFNGSALLPTSESPVKTSNEAVEDVRLRALDEL